MIAISVVYVAANLFIWRFVHCASRASATLPPKGD